MYVSQELYSDEKIIENIQNGNKELFGFLIDRYESKIKMYTTRFLYDEEDRKDIVQDIFIKTYINIQDFDTKQKFSSWLYRIAHNECINKIKKKKSIAFSFFENDTIFNSIKDKSDPITDYEIKIAKEAVEKSLSKLPDKYREIIILYFFEELSYSEISDVLKISVTNVGIRLQRAKQLLKNVLEK